MKLTPRNIEEASFGKSAFGYVKEEVDQFLKELADEFADCLNENEEIKKELIRTKDELEQFKKIEKNLQSTLLDAQESTQKTIIEAREQAKSLVAEAEAHADELRRSVTGLEEAKKRLVAELTAIIDSQEIVLKRHGFLSSSEGVSEEKEKLNNETETEEIDE
jgi:cell division initiation protein